MGTKKQAREREGPCPQRARRYDAQTKREAVSWAQRHGAAAAAAKLGMSERSVQLWQQAARPTSAKVVAPAPARVRATKAVAAAPANAAVAAAVGRAAGTRASSPPERSTVSSRAVRSVTDATQTHTWGRRGRRYGVAEKQEITQAYLERRAAAYAGLDPAAHLNAIVDEILSVPPIAPVAHHFWRRCLRAVAETVPSKRRRAVRRSVCLRIRRRYTVTQQRRHALVDEVVRLLTPSPL